jgi:hypothetical protein
MKIEEKDVTILCKKDVYVDDSEKKLFQKGQLYHGMSSLNNRKLEVEDETLSDFEIAHGKEYYTDDEWFQEHFEVINEKPIEFRRPEPL